MSILRHEGIAPDVRNAYLSLAAKRRRQMGEESEAAARGAARSRRGRDGETGGDEGGDLGRGVRRSRAARGIRAERDREGLWVSTSAYDYRITGRGGQGIDNMDLTRRSDAVVAVFPVGQNDQVMLVTDGGMVIRCPVNDIRIARRRSQGVVIFKVGEGERVVSVARLPEESEENGDADEPTMTRRTIQQTDEGDR